MRRLVLAAMLAACLSFTAPARAQIPVPPIPPLPPEVSLVLEYVAPVASPVCGTAGFAVLIVQGVGAGVVDPTTFGPIFIVCGAIPVPDEQLTCAADNQVQAVLDEVFFAAIGSESLVSGRVTGPVVEELIVLQDALPPPLNSAGLAEQVVGTLECYGPEPEPVPPPVGFPSSETPGSEPVALPELPVDGGSFEPIVIGGTPVAGGSQPRAAAPRSAARPTQRLNQAPAVAIVGGRELSVVVFLLPLLLLAACVVIGRGLLDDMDDVGPGTRSG